ncbi:MAG: metallophosphoesterase [Desulfurococcales archaeon]|nr:metallophosphoesterase [Desulfurococcales archaeon]
MDSPPGIAAVSDVHSPLYLEAYKRSLKLTGLSNVDIVVFAGDMVERNMINAFAPLEEATREAFPNAQIVAVFGNDEFMEHEDEYRRLYPRVVWLDNELYNVDIRGYKLGIIGSRGAIDRPTWWQAKHIPNIRELYARRVEKIKSLLEESTGKNDITILVTHYGLASCTLIGEPPKGWPGIYSKKVEGLVRKYKPNAAIHGHAHKGKGFCRLDSIPIYNVAFPVNRRVVKIGYTISLLGFR